MRIVRTASAVTAALALLATTATTALAFGGAREFGTGGGGSLVAQDTGLAGYGFTRDVMYWPAGVSDYISQLAISFQVNVDPYACPFIGVGQPTLTDFMSFMVTWDTGVILDSADSDLVAFENPGGWVEIVVGDPTTAPPDDMPICAACGITPTDAMDNVFDVFECAYW